MKLVPTSQSAVHSLLLLGWLTLAMVLSPASSPAAPPAVRVLMWTGQNNHDWRQTTPRIREILMASGRFTVDVTEHPEQGTAEQFARYDVILSDWNAWGEVPVKAWPPAMQTAFLNFVRHGGGHVVVHAGGASFPDWADYQQLIGGTWGKHTGHGAVHTFEVRPVDRNDPVTRGMVPFQTSDELWHRMTIQPDVHVLATAFSAPERGGSGADEPVAFSTEFGQGRCFNLVLGHNVAAMAAPGFHTLLQRGTEWAATGKVTLPRVVLPSDERIAALLASVTTHRPTGSREPLAAMADLVQSAAPDPVARQKLAAQLAAALASTATPEGKQFICTQLSLIGGGREVPVLAGLLEDPDVGYHARLALERIPGPEATAALVARLSPAAQETAAQRIACIQSLGARQAEAAVPDLARLATASDPETARAALSALGQVGSLAAARALQSTAAELPAALRPQRDAALLDCAHQLSGAGESSALKPLLEDLCASSRAAPVRSAAFPLLLATLGEGGGARLVSALTGDDPVLQAAALRALASASPSIRRTAMERLDQLPAELQVRMLTLARERPDAAFLPAIRQAAGNRLASVRLAALRALGFVGDASTVPWLVDQLEPGSPEEREAVVEALSRLPGTGVDAALGTALGESRSPVQREHLIGALVARNAQSAAPALLETAGASQPAVRQLALQALGKLGDRVTAEALVRRLEQSSAADAAQIEGALVQIGERTGDVTPLTAALTRAPAAARGHLISALGTLGGASALAALRGELQSPDPTVQLAAVRALANWPTPEPLEALSERARTATDPRVKAVALRAACRLASLAQDRPDTAAAALVSLLPGASSQEDREALISALGAVPSVVGLNALLPYLERPGTAAVAAPALLQIAERIHPWHRAEARTALARVKDTSADPALQARATQLTARLDAPANLAAGGVATSPDGLEKDGAAGGDQAAIDGDVQTYWDEADGHARYRLRVQLGRPSVVGFLRLTGWQHHDHAPRDFDVLCDDRVVKSVRNAQYRENVLELGFPPVTCTTVELNITGYYGQSPAIRELELYEQTPAPQ